MVKNKIIRLAKTSVTLTLTASLVLTAAFVSSAESTKGKSPDSYESLIIEGKSDFFNYYEENLDKQVISYLTEVSSKDFQIGKLKTQTFENKNAVLITEGNTVTFNVSIKENGVYPFALDYYNLDSSDSDYIISVKADGKTPYDECKSMTLPRLWKDDVDKGFEKDELGNEIRPPQSNRQKWVTNYINDARGFYSLPYFIYLESGVHSISITSERNTFALAGVIFGYEDIEKSYEEYSANASEYKGEPIKLQAEKTFEKNSSILYPTYDRTNSATEPQSAKNVLLNTVGKDTWKKIGDTVAWKPDIKEAGWYSITFRARQKTNQGLFSYRTLKINGEVPFKEAETLAFKYDPDWYIETLGGEEPYLFYLEPGDVVSLTVTNGSVGEILRKVNFYTLKLNALYREIIAITSTSPDGYRDYMLNSQLPHLEGELEIIAKALKEISADFEKITGTKGSQASIIDYVVGVLSDFAYDCNEIPARFSAYQSVLENLGSLITTIGEQPLELDYIVVGSENTSDLKENDNWFKQFIFSAQSFLASFATDYNGVSAVEGGKKSLTVWAAVGRDQAKTINNLIRNDFSKNHDTQIKLSIVPGGDILIKASLAGKGPDVSLLAGVPLELAARGALVPLTDYGIDSIKDQFVDDVWTAMSYNGDIYALPDSMQFYTMFYREDILNEYGLKAPNTWEDFYKAVEELQKNNLKIGIPEINAANYGVSSGISIFTMFLLQNGGKFFSDDLDEALFNTEEAFTAFEQWVNLHKLYGNDREFSFYSRFRTGEMPLSIQLYSAYNQIAAAAPEIQGLWNMAPIPGTAKGTGTVDRSQYGTASGCYMLKSALNKGIDKEAFEFMKWWVSAEVQTAYAKDLEATMGIAARYTPANVVAINNLGWSSSELAILNESLKFVYFEPQIPGNYLLQRSLTTAFRSAVNGKNRARRALTIANKEINDELERKREEFNLNKKENN